MRSDQVGYCSSRDDGSIAVTFNAGARVPVSHAECRRVSNERSIPSSCPVKQTHGTIPAMGRELYEQVWSAGKPGRQSPALFVFA